jgi:hypothetical protein
VVSPPVEDIRLRWVSTVEAVGTRVDSLIIEKALQLLPVQFVRSAVHSFRVPDARLDALGREPGARVYPDAGPTESVK